MQIIEAVHKETFVRNDELDYCDLLYLRNMLNSRKFMSQDAVTGTEVSECISQDLESTKKNLIAALKLRLKCSDSCCICMDKFIPGDRIRVLQFYKTLWGGGGSTSSDTLAPDGEHVSLKEALQKAGVGNGENVRIRQWKKSEEVKLKAYLGQRMSIGRIKVLMGIGYDIVEKKIKEEGWLVW